MYFPEIKLSGPEIVELMSRTLILKKCPID